MASAELIADLQRIIGKPVAEQADLKGYRREIKTLMERARRNYDNVQKAGLQFESKFRSLTKGGRFSTKGKKGEDYAKEILRAINFVESDSATVTKILDNSAYNVEDLSKEEKIAALKNISAIKEHLSDSILDALRKSEMYDSSQTNQYIGEAYDLINRNVNIAQMSVDDAIDYVLDELGIAPNGWQPLDSPFLKGQKLFTPK